ncbi:MAG: hypothetical protein U0Z26_17085 [Anaerolineales bacterium]
MQALAIAKPGNLTLSSLLEKMHPQLGKHHSLIVVTASQKIDWLKSTPSLINRGVIPTVILLDPATFGSETSAQGMSAVLGQRGIQHHIIPRGLIQPPKIVPTTQGKWTWRATSTGEIVPVQH